MHANYFVTQEKREKLPLTYNTTNSGKIARIIK